MNRTPIASLRALALVLGILLIAGGCALARANDTASATTSSVLPTTTTTTIPAIDLPLPPGDNSVYILGDSVILGTQYVIDATLAGWKVTLDAKESDAERARLLNLGRYSVERVTLPAGQRPPVVLNEKRAAV